MPDGPMDAWYVTMATKKTKSRADETTGRLQIIGKTISDVCARHGKEAIMALGGDPGHTRHHAIIRTGSFGLDRALGIGGLPQGRIIEIYGPESSGKTTLTLHVIAEAQKSGKICAFIDAEHALDSRYAAKLGVNLDELLVSQPDHGEQALDIVDALTRSGAMGLIVIDSVAALVPRSELEGEMGDRHLGLQARLMSQAMRKLSSIAQKTGTTVIFINQLRHKIGVTFGSPEVTTGGNALKYYASVRLDIRRIATIKEGDEARANRCRVKVAKNKVAPPYTTAEFEIVFGSGIDRVAEVLDLAMEQGLISKAGSWFSQGDRRLGQGRVNVISWLRTNPDELKALERSLSLDSLGGSAVKPQTAGTPSAGRPPGRSTSGLLDKVAA